MRFQTKGGEPYARSDRRIESKNSLPYVHSYRGRIGGSGSAVRALSSARLAGAKVQPLPRFFGRWLRARTLARHRAGGRKDWPPHRVIFNPTQYNTKGRRFLQRNRLPFAWPPERSIDDRSGPSMNGWMDGGAAVRRAGGRGSGPRECGD